MQIMKRIFKYYKYCRISKNLKRRLVYFVNTNQLQAAGHTFYRMDRLKIEYEHMYDIYIISKALTTPGSLKYPIKIYLPNANKHIQYYK